MCTSGRAWGWAKGTRHLMGTEFQFHQEEVLELGYIHNNENILGTTQLYTYNSQHDPFIVFYHKVPAYKLTDRHCAQAQGDGVMQPSTHDPEVTGPSVRLRFPQKNMQFQSIHRPPESQQGNSRVRTNLEKRLLPMCLWTLQLQGSVNRNKTPRKT